MLTVPSPGTFILSAILFGSAGLSRLAAQADARILYKQFRFVYAYPGINAKLKTETVEYGTYRQNAYPSQAIKQHSTWLFPPEEKDIALFDEGVYLLYTQVGLGNRRSRGSWLNFFAGIKRDGSKAVKYEASSHRDSTWGIVHSWKYIEWAGRDLSEEWPLFAMIEAIYGEVQSTKHVASISNNFRVSHLRLDGAGEDFIGNVDVYLGRAKHPLGGFGQKFKSRQVNFSVDVKIVSGKPVVTWKRGSTPKMWKTESIHSFFHSQDWHVEVRKAEQGMPEPIPPESNCFALIGDPRRGLKPAEVTSIINWKSFRPGKKLRPRPLGYMGKSPSLPGKRRKMHGFVRFKGGKFLFDCKELGIRIPIEAPDDLREMLTAWVTNFPTRMSRRDKRDAWALVSGK